MILLADNALSLLDLPTSNVKRPYVRRSAALSDMACLAREDSN